MEFHMVLACALLPFLLLSTSTDPLVSVSESSSIEESVVSDAVSRAVVFLLGRQEGTNDAEWPYEGVYRVRPYEDDYEGRAQIPYGYRVGGTSIAASALMQAPGYEEDEARQAAVEKATQFVIDAIEHELMSPDYDGGYDVRGWGYIYGLDFLMRMERQGWTPKPLEKQAHKAAQFYIKSLSAIEIPESGGWSYSRRGPLDKASATSPFMTGPAVQALMAAHAEGYKVSKTMIQRALDALERGRMKSGEVVYSTPTKKPKDPELLPGSIGRMLTTETTLLIARRGSEDRVRHAIHMFFDHWEWLDKRRAQDGTHIKPYYVAPYYFYYAHFQAAQAIEELPEDERDEFRELLRERLWAVRMEDGMWNDRVFPRTANYGTAITVLALTAPGADRPLGRRK